MQPTATAHKSLAGKKMTMALDHSSPNPMLSSNNNRSRAMVADLDVGMEPVLDENEKRLLTKNVHGFMPDVYEKFPDLAQIDPDSWNNIPVPLVLTVKQFTDCFRHL
jgi:hypothetical protein